MDRRRRGTCEVIKYPHCPSRSHQLVLIISEISLVAIVNDFVEGESRYSKSSRPRSLGPAGRLIAAEKRPELEHRKEEWRQRRRQEEEEVAEEQTRDEDSRAYRQEQHAHEEELERPEDAGEEG